MDYFSSNVANFLNLDFFVKTLIIVFLLTIFILLSPHSFLLENSGNFYDNLIDEDGFIEYGTSFSYLLSSIFSIFISNIFLKTKKQKFAIIYLLFGIIFLMGCLEEISWGQRIFDIDTPEFLSANLQNELNLHNFLESKNLILFFTIIGFYGSFAWILLFSLKNTSKISFVKYFVPKGPFVIFFLPIFLYGLNFLLLSNNIFFYHMTMMKHYILLEHVGEFFEFSLSVAVLFFILDTFSKVKSKQFSYTKN